MKSAPAFSKAKSFLPPGGKERLTCGRYRPLLPRVLVPASTRHGQAIGKSFDALAPRRTAFSYKSLFISQPPPSPTLWTGQPHLALQPAEQHVETKDISTFYPIPSHPIQTPS
jgi:hypothetical protein